MRRSFFFASGTALLLLAACQPSRKPQPLTGADSTALTKVRTDFMAAWNAGNVDGLVALYAADGELQPSDVPAVKGKNALQTYYNKTLGTPMRPKLDVPQGTVVGRQDLATASGPFTMTPPAPAAPAKGAAPAAPAPMPGKYLIVLMRQVDGSWKIAYDAVTMDAPMPAPAPAAPAKRGGRR
jgi:ketosteroid isomerase-like protein